MLFLNTMVYIFGGNKKQHPVNEDVDSCWEESGVVAGASDPGMARVSSSASSRMGVCGECI